MGGPCQSEALGIVLSFPPLMALLKLATRAAELRKCIYGVKKKHNTLLALSPAHDTQLATTENTPKVILTSTHIKQFLCTVGKT